MYKEIVDRLIPQKSEIKVEFDEKKKIFWLSAPIFASNEMPVSVKNYIDARKDYTFKPHVTSFHLEGERVFLRQEMPFEMEMQETLRQRIHLFWRMSKQCRRMLLELAVEEKYKDIGVC